MMAQFVKVYREILTGRDNTTHDVARHSWLWSMVGIAALAAWNAIHGVPVGLREFAEACGIVGASHGIAIGVKGKTEPESTVAES